MVIVMVGRWLRWFAGELCCPARRGEGWTLTLIRSGCVDRVTARVVRVSDIDFVDLRVSLTARLSPAGWNSATWM